MDISGRPPLQHGSFVSINTEDMWPGLGTARIKEPFYYSSLFTYASRSNIKDYFSCPQSICVFVYVESGCMLYCYIVTMLHVHSEPSNIALKQQTQM